MTFADIGRIVIPVFGMIGIGYGAGKLRLFAASVGEALGEFVFALPVPMLIFRTIATAHFPNVSPWPLWIAYFVGVTIAWGLTSAFSTRILRLRHAEGVIAGVSASFSNSVMIGLPLVYTAYGEAGAVPLLLLISVHMPIMMVAGTLLSERAQRLDGGSAEGLTAWMVARRIGGNLIANPIVIAVIGGGIWRTLGLDLDGPPRTIIDQFAGAAIPCALFSLGMGLQRYGLLGDLPVALAATVVKLVLMPLIVYLVASRLTDLPALWVTVATVCAALPAGVNSYLFAVRFKCGHAGASTAISLTSALGLVTLTLWMSFLGGQ